jgi:hypothetical protein
MSFYSPTSEHAAMGGRVIWQHCTIRALKDAEQKRADRTEAACVL